MKILHLYHDLMNLYGDYANVSALCRILDTNGIEYTLDKQSLGYELSLLDYDFIFVGSGSEESQKKALDHLRDYREDLKEYIESGKVALFTGNSFEMMGKSISSFLGEFEALGIFDFTTSEQNKTRKTADAIFKFQQLENELVGFVNKCSTIEGIETPLFEVIRGLGNTNDKCEGVLYKNLFGTHLTGPVLVKNPHFLKYIAEKLVGEELNTDAFEYEKKGYKITINNLKQ